MDADNLDEMEKRDELWWIEVAGGYLFCGLLIVCVATLIAGALLS